jgi:uncharacterized protein GlcG (DUF336 family)
MNHEITLEGAEKMIHAAKSKAEELKILEDIAVVDASGNLKAFVRMDGAWLGSIDIAIRKARTARYFDTYGCWRTRTYRHPIGSGMHLFSGCD